MPIPMEVLINHRFPRIGHILCWQDRPSLLHSAVMKHETSIIGQMFFMLNKDSFLPAHVSSFNFFFSLDHQDFIYDGQCSVSHGYFPAIDGNSAGPESKAGMEAVMFGAPVVSGRLFLLGIAARREVADSCIEKSQI